MSVQTGYNWRMKRRADSEDYHLGGRTADAEPAQRPDITQEIGTGQYGLIYLSHNYSIPTMRFTLKLQRLENFIADHSGANKFCFVDTEGALSEAEIWWTNGLVAHKYTGSLVNTCTVRIPVRGTVTAEIDLRAEATAAQTFGNDATALNDNYLTKANLNTFDLGETDLMGEFRELSFGINHNIGEEALGQPVSIEVWQQQSVYTGSIDRALKTQSEWVNAYNGTTQDVTIQINDNQTVPVKTKFTFADALISSIALPVRGLDLVYERIDWISRNLTLEAGS